MFKKIADVLLEELTETLRRDRKQISLFIEEMQADPHYTLSRKGDEAFRLSARVKIYQTLVQEVEEALLDNAEKISRGEDERKWEDFVAGIEKYIAKSVVSNASTMSKWTSVAMNVMEQEVVRAWADLSVEFGLKVKCYAHMDFSEVQEQK